MVFRRCPQCGSTSDDAYGFCIKCGREFPKIEVSKNSCPLCGFQNPNEADFCVKCGTPLVFKNNVENGNVVQPIVINRPDEQVMPPVQNRIKVKTAAGSIILFHFIALTFQGNSGCAGESGNT